MIKNKRTLSEACLATRGLAEDGGAARAEDNGLGVAEDGGDLIAACVEAAFSLRDFAELATTYQGT